MKLSELKTGEHGVIVKVTGHGGFRKRVVEMGFIKGKKITVLLNAPLHDPVKYQIMGYEVSLRHSEADKIEVISESEAKAANLLTIDKEKPFLQEDRKSTRLNSSHANISYAVFCLKKKKMILYISIHFNDATGS